MGQLTSIIDTSYKIPRAFLQVTLGAGPRSPGSAAMRILLTGNKTSAGTLAAATPLDVAGPDDVETAAGTGSELHLMALALFKANPSALVTIIVIAEAGTAASKALTFTAGPATAPGTVEVWIRGQRVTAAVSTGDTITNVAASVAAAINGRPELGVTAVAAVGVCTVTAKNTGVRGNWISCRSKLTGGTGVSHTAATGYLSAGATSDDPQAALDAVISQRYHFIVSPHYTSTELTKYKTHINANALPIAGRREVLVFPSPDTLATTNTLTDTLNMPRATCGWMENPDATPGMLAAAYAGALARVCSSDRAFNTDGLELTGIPTQFSLADIPTEAEQNVALNNGITPLLGKNGVVSVVRAITTYHLDASTNDDFSILDLHYVLVADFVADDIEINFASTYRGFKIGADDANGAPPAPRVATPLSVRDWIYGRLKAQENKLLVNVDANLVGIIVEQDSANPGRLNAEIPIDCIELFHQLAANVSQIG